MEFDIVTGSPNWGVKRRAFNVYAFTMVFTMGLTAAIYGAGHTFGLISDKSLESFWEVSPLASVVIGIIAGVGYMHNEMKKQIEELKSERDLRNILDQERFTPNKLN
jgi:hypothetical protein